MLLEELLHFFIIPFILGIIGGMAAYGFRWLIKAFETLYIHLDFIHRDTFYLISMPLLFWGSHFLVSKYLRDHTNVTIDEVAKKISMMSGKFSFLKGLFVLFLTSLSIGFGVPIGREGPIAKLGGLLSEIFLLGVKVQRVNLPIYLSAGVSASIAATFNAPIAGIIFGIEIIIGRINTYIIVPLIVATATATLFAREFIGDYTAFYVPPLSYDQSYYPYFPVAGIFFAFLTFLLTRSFNRFQKLRRRHWKRWPYVVVVLGFLVGALIVFEPEIQGVGYDYVSELYGDVFRESNVFAIMLAKVVGLILSIGSGIFGGLMSPSIFIGSFGGYWLGDLFAQYGGHFDPRVFALVGSAAMLAGVTRAPLRSTIIIAELTHSYQLLLPILITTAVTAYLVSKTVSGSYFKRSLLQKGIDIENKNVEAFLDNCTLKGMVEKVPPLHPNTSLNRIGKIFRRSRTNYLAVVDDSQKLIGVISLRDVRKSSLLKKKKLTVADLMSPQPFAIHEGHKKEDLYKALSMLNAGHIPYVTEDNTYIGMLNMAKFLKELTLHQQSVELRDKIINL
ncbi:chloride channel protein [Nitratifractor sp.]|uniref:chloride channel protein n=1 Tax=Nitratifractor sp. TaxID=2268144 RepID=UPI0025EA3BD4|nr:chloride channel protein [Nitratifractor sp.]